MCNDRSQALHIRGSHSRDSFLAVYVGAVTPTHLQLPSGHHRVDLNEVTSSSRRAAVAAARFTRRGEQRFLIQHTIDLAQVVETDFCLRQRPQSLARFAEVSQHAIAESLSRYLAHLLLDLLHDFANFAACYFQQHRIDRGEPAYRPRHIDALADGFAPVS